MTSLSLTWLVGHHLSLSQPPHYSLGSSHYLLSNELCFVCLINSQNESSKTCSGDIFLFETLHCLFVSEKTWIDGLWGSISSVFPQIISLAHSPGTQGVLCFSLFFSFFFFLICYSFYLGKLSAQIPASIVPPHSFRSSSGFYS